MTGKVLLISGSIPPNITGSAVIVGNLAKQFTADEMIVGGEWPIGRPAVAWRDDWARLVYLAVGWPATWRGARWWRRLQFPLILLRSVRLAKKHRCSAVVAVFPKEEFLIIGYLTALWTSASFFPYFHNTWVENRGGVARWLAQWFQARIFAEADHIFLMSEGMVEHYRERYPQVKCSALVHSFNEQLPVFSPPPDPGSPLQLTICGDINESCRDAVVRVSEAILRIDDTELTFLTGTPRSQLAHLGLMRDRVRYDSVSRDEVVERLQRSDIVVLPHGFTGDYSQEEYQTIFPTRTIEYLICGRPILAHTPPDCYLTRFLNDRECAFVVDKPGISELRKAIERLRADPALRSKLTRNALKAAEQFFAPHVAATLRARLETNGHESHN
jgi:glycosyltransferase involved in cell wall biosynthesis